MASPFDTLGAEFADFCAAVAGAAAAALVTVRQIDPDTGDTLATAANVTALALPETAAAFPARGGEVGGETGMFWLVGTGMGFVPGKRDRITDADGVAWIVDECERVGYGATGTLYRCPVTKARS